GRPGRRPGARAAPHHPRRAVDRARRRLGPAGQDRAARKGARRRHRHHDHPYPGSGRAHGRAHRRHRRRPPRRRGHAGRAARPPRPRKHARRHLSRPGRRRGRHAVSLPAGSLPWFARHELRLAWRDFAAMLTRGRTRRLVGVAIGGALVYAVLHVIAWFAIRAWAVAGFPLDTTTLALVTGTGLLFWAVTLS